MKKILTASFTSLILVATGVVFAANLTIEADKQKYTDYKNEANFEGNVKVRLDDITVTSPKANAKLDPKTKKITDADFLEKAYVYQIKNNKKNEVKANIIKLSLLNKIVTAEGDTQTIVTEDKKLEPLVIINADTQEYNTNTKTMYARGNVIINYQKAVSYSSEGVAKLDSKGEIEELQLIGNVKIKRDDDNFQADKYIYKAKTGDAIATGNVYSEMHNKDGTKITVKSEFQEYNKNANTMTASKNVNVVYADYTAVGPKASVFPDPKTNKLNKVVFSGRSKITQEGRTIEADYITMTMDPKDFSAEGHVKTFIPNVKTISGN